MENKTILALYPNRRGIAYALFHDKDLVDYGIKNTYPFHLKKTHRKIQQFLSYYKPDIVISRNINDLKKNQSKKTQRIIDMICTEAKLQKLEVFSYTRTQIKQVFVNFKCTTKFEISKKLMEWFSELRAYEFPKRKSFMTEDYNTGFFDAVSLAVVHWYFND
ncbi:hypothetical protein [Polaribacter cellanae]|uniref:Uncharacterized protein n=1 Tax=Polaribacter cellanae TaxID=2818493 RepID=A0A975H5P0_9FLAO|nr:hypothetical protein [Polaribacter cellanae]QTE21074.1 hypothetical protein J3359_09450 [Polaribacter cellanae]